MIQMQTYLDVADNTGAKQAQCIKVLGGTNRRYAGLGDIVVANLEVAKLILGPASRMRPAFVEVPLKLDDELALTMLASIVSLTPGTVSADLSDDKRTLLIHGLNVDDEAALVRSIQTRYEAPLLEVFACSRT